MGRLLKSFMMKFYKIGLLLWALTLGCVASAQMENESSEIEQIRKTLMDYIEGTANGEPERLRDAFHQDLNLYSVAGDTLRPLSGQTYIGYFEDRKPRNRIGRIISIDYENDAATAKIEILMPARKRMYTDYLLLLKLQGKWKIIHKSFTFRAYPE